VLHRRCKSFGSSDRTGVGGLDADLSLEVTAPSLGGRRREKIQEEGSDMDFKNCLSINQVLFHTENVYWLIDGESKEMGFGHNQIESENTEQSEF